ncbi:MAG: electron transfer flavoprotein subunit alpha/FixB family protein [Acidimicrobiia bacterium]|nr:electron transfer flavoprotein subunit alpha/FixB family protein [Acidimicrobiia bacterium]
MLIWVFAETAEGEGVSTTTLELLTKAREIGDTVECFIASSDASGVAATLGEYGAAKVYAVDTGDQLPGAAAAAAIAAKASEANPDLLLFATSYDGRDVSGRLSARLDVPVITNVLDIAVEGGAVTCETAIFGATKIVRTQFADASPRIVLVRPKSFGVESAAGGSAAVETVPVPDVGTAGSTRVLERHVEALEGPKLEDADIVVSGGRGLGSAEAFGLVEQLAEVLGAATGASRAIVDAGWVPYSKQVGQTGKTVKPNVYIALGISGAMQHMVGMKGSKNIIAVNKDGEAPIHAVADIGIVGDVHKVVPQLIEALKSRG